MSKKTGRPRLVILMGPTGVGKSKLAMEWVEALGGEILSADSMQVYRYMDIGTAKPGPEDQKRIKHHLLDLVNPDESFHAAQYRTLGRKAIDRLDKAEKNIWVVGGAGLYIRTLIQGIFSSPRIDTRVRENLKREAEKNGPETLYERLKKVDSTTAQQLHPNDLYRVIRALEVFDATGIPISFYREQHQFGERPYQTLKIGLEINRERLYDLIDQRVDRMLEQGLLQEVQGLLEKGFGPGLKTMQSLGYKQMAQFILKKMGWKEAVQEMKRDTRHYAKRQLTWFKADPEIRWIGESEDREKMFLAAKSFFES